VKLRHVRVVAVTAVVLVALTGARRSGGGGCSGDSDSGSSSTSTSGGVTSGGSSSGSSGTGGSGTDSATRDVTIADCKVNAERKVVARLRIDNPDAGTAMTYGITVEFKDAQGLSWGTASVFGHRVPAGQVSTVEAEGVYTGGRDGSEVTRCEVTSATRY